jgi:flagellar basal body-associated protein FliL
MNKSYLITLSIVLLVVGLVAGYFYGHAKGIDKGRADLLAEQEQAQQEAAAKVLKEVQEAANPFTEEAQVVNPFEKVEYKNPFEGAAVNPFAE